MSNKYISDYVYLAEASYTDFSKGLEREIVRDALIDEDNGGKPKQFADLVTQNYTLEAHWEDRGTILNTESGFSGTLFKGTGTQEKGGNAGMCLL